MDSTELEAVLTDCGVSPTIASQLVGDGWNLKNFRTVVSEVSEFDNIWDQLVYCTRSVMFVGTSLYVFPKTFWIKVTFRCVI